MMIETSGLSLIAWGVLTAAWGEAMRIASPQAANSVVGGNRRVPLLRDHAATLLLRGRQPCVNVVAEVVALLDAQDKRVADRVLRFAAGAAPQVDAVLPAQQRHPRHPNA